MRAGNNRQVASKKALLTFLLAVCLCLCGCAHYGKPCGREYKVFCGMSSPEGEVSEADWRRFCDTHVTAAFPDGYTSFEGTGYWRNHGDITMRENTRVLLIVAPVDAKEKVLRLARQYCEMFHQEAVLVVTSNIDAAFVEEKK